MLGAKRSWIGGVKMRTLFVLFSGAVLVNGLSSSARQGLRGRDESDDAYETASERLSDDTFMEVSSKPVPIEIQLPSVVAKQDCIKMSREIEMPSVEADTTVEVHIKALQTIGFHIDPETGRVRSVDKESSAAKGGLKQDDIILMLDDKAMRSSNKFNQKLFRETLQTKKTKDPDGTIKLQVHRMETGGQIKRADALKRRAAHQVAKIGGGRLLGSIVPPSKMFMLCKQTRHIQQNNIDQILEVARQQGEIDTWRVPEKDLDNFLMELFHMIVFGHSGKMVEEIVRKIADHVRKKFQMDYFEWAKFIEVTIAFKQEQLNITEIEKDNLYRKLRNWDDAEKKWKFAGMILEEDDPDYNQARPIPGQHPDPYHPWNQGPYARAAIIRKKLEELHASNEDEY